MVFCNAVLTPRKNRAGACRRRGASPVYMFTVSAYSNLLGASSAPAGCISRDGRCAGLQGPALPAIEVVQLQARSLFRGASLLLRVQLGGSFCCAASAGKKFRLQSAKRLQMDEMFGVKNVHCRFSLLIVPPSMTVRYGMFRSGNGGECLAATARVF